MEKYFWTCHTSGGFTKRKIFLKETDCTNFRGTFTNHKTKNIFESDRLYELPGDVYKLQNEKYFCKETDCTELPGFCQKIFFSSSLFICFPFLISCINHYGRKKQDHESKRLLGLYAYSDVSETARSHTFPCLR